MKDRNQTADEILQHTKIVVIAKATETKYTKVHITTEFSSLCYEMLYVQHDYDRLLDTNWPSNGQMQRSYKA